jgi:uncharacterized membrane protein
MADRAMGEYICQIEGSFFMNSDTHKDRRLSTRLEHHVRKRLIAGFFLLLPIGITLAILRFLFFITAGLLVPVFKKLFGELPDSLLLFISIVAFLLIIYGLGLITTHVIGRRLVTFGENIILRLPLLKTLYGASKQVVETFSASNKATFKSVVLLEFPRRGLKSVGFVTGTLVDAQGNTCYKVFVPTTPNPTSGFFQIVPRDDVQQTDLSVEDGIKMIISGGILSPQNLGEMSLSCQEGEE